MQVRNRRSSLLITRYEHSTLERWWYDSLEHVGTTVLL